MCKVADLGTCGVIHGVIVDSLLGSLQMGCRILVMRTIVGFVPIISGFDAIFAFVSILSMLKIFLL